MTFVLARANINLRGFPAGTVGWVNPSDPNIKMYVECQYIDLLPEGEQDGRTQVLTESASPPDFISEGQGV